VVRGVMKSNHDLVFALERLRDSYKQLLGERPVTKPIRLSYWQSKLLSGTPGTLELCSFLTRATTKQSAFHYYPALLQSSPYYPEL